MNKTEEKLLQKAVDNNGRVDIDRYKYNGREHKAACYLHSENYGIYFASDSIPHFRLHSHVKRALSKQRK